MTSIATTAAAAVVTEIVGSVRLRHGSTYRALGYVFPDKRTFITVTGEKALSFFENETTEVDIRAGDEIQIETRNLFEVKRGKKASEAAAEVADAPAEGAAPARRRAAPVSA